MSTLMERERNTTDRLENVRSRIQSRHPLSYILISVETGWSVIVPRVGDPSGGLDTALIEFAKRHGRDASYGLFLGCQL